jgi:hypothetical protein
MDSATAIDIPTAQLNEIKKKFFEMCGNNPRAVAGVLLMLYVELHDVYRKPKMTRKEIASSATRAILTLEWGDAGEWVH